ncbi:DUF397 domain-containing protein [Streptomyces sp. NPDC048172]|uniref:DUF397 domain-containing protein n=1 Tax=Streptomyces sp. NPDC048172 TaxID=3365505 RepID=UPI00371E1A2B
MQDSQLTWVKSSYSNEPQGECVECALGAERVQVRDSKDPERPPISMSRAAWTAFTAALDVGRPRP